MSYADTVGQRSAIKATHEIIVKLYSLAGAGKKSDYYTFLLDFLNQSKMSYIPDEDNDVNVLIRMNPELQSVDESEEKCLFQSSIIDSIHDFGKRGITSDELKSYPSKSDNYTFTGMMFTLMQNTLYSNLSRKNELSGSYFSSFKASFSDIKMYSNKVSITSDVEDYILLLSIKRGILKNATITSENIEEETEKCLKITRSVEGADQAKLIGIRTEIEDFFRDFIDNDVGGTGKLNILIDTIKNFKRVLTINDGVYPFAHITTRESVHDSATSKTSPLSPNDARGYYGDNIFCEAPVRVESYSKNIAVGEEDVRTYFSNNSPGQFNSIFEIKLGGIKYYPSQGESLGVVADYKYNGNNMSFNSVLNQRGHPTNTTTVTNEIKSIKSKTALFLTPSQRAEYRDNWGNFDYLYDKIFLNLKYKDDETTFKYSFYYTKKRAGDGLQAEICRKVTKKEEVIRAYRIKTGAPGENPMANLNTSTTYILKNLILVTQDRALFSVCITNDVPAILSTYSSYILFKPKTTETTAVPVAISISSEPLLNSAKSTIKPTIPTKPYSSRSQSKLKMKGGSEGLDMQEDQYETTEQERVETEDDVGTIITDIIDLSRDPIYFFRIFQKIARNIITSVSSRNSNLTKYLDYVENFEMEQMEGNQVPVFGIYELLKDPTYFSMSSEEDEPANWEIIECLYNLKIPPSIMTFTNDDSPIVSEIVSETELKTFDVDEIANPITELFDINSNVESKLITNINVRDISDERYSPYSIFLGFEINGIECKLNVVKIKDVDKNVFKIITNFGDETTKNLSYLDILTFVKFGSRQFITRKTLKDFTSNHSYETDEEEKFFKDVLELMDSKEMETSVSVGGSSSANLNVSFTSLPLLNYYILLFYNLPILIDESANNLVMLSYLNIFESFEVSLCVDDDLITENFDDDSILTNKKLLYLFFYHLIDDYGVENVSYNMLEYFLKKEHPMLYFDLYRIIGYVYDCHRLFIPFTPSDIIEKNIEKGIISKDGVFNNSQTYFESIYRKAIDSTINDKYFTRNGFMFMSKIFTEKIHTDSDGNKEIDAIQMNDVKHEMNHVNHELSDVKDEMDNVNHEMSNVKDEVSQIARLQKLTKSRPKYVYKSESRRISMLEKKLKKLRSELKSKRKSKSKKSKSKKSKSNKPKYSKNSTLKLNKFERFGNVETSNNNVY